MNKLHAIRSGILWAVALSLAPLEVPASSEEMHWDYEGENGPAHWGIGRSGPTLSGLAWF